LVWHGPPAGWSSDAGEAADIVRRLPVDGGEDDVDCHTTVHTVIFTMRPFLNFE